MVDNVHKQHWYSVLAYSSVQEFQTQTYSNFKASLLEVTRIHDPTPHKSYTYARLYSKHTLEPFCCGALQGLGQFICLSLS